MVSLVVYKMPARINQFYLAKKINRKYRQKFNKTEPDRGAKPAVGRAVGRCRGDQCVVPSDSVTKEHF